MPMRTVGFSIDLQHKPGEPRGTLRISAEDGSLHLVCDFDAAVYPGGVAVGLAIASLGAVVAGVPHETVNAVTREAAAELDKPTRGGDA